MRRREFLVAAGAAPGPRHRHQQADKLPTIGFLGADSTAFAPWTAAFVARLAELGWVDGKTIAIEYRWSQGRSERYAEIAAEFVRLKVDVIVTVGSAVPTVKQATAVIPIVFAVGIDPLFERSESQVPCGATRRQRHWTIDPDGRVGKRPLEFARELVPRLHRLAIMFNIGNASPCSRWARRAAARMPNQSGAAAS